MSEAATQNGTTSGHFPNLTPAQKNDAALIALMDRIRDTIAARDAKMAFVWVGKASMPTFCAWVDRVELTERKTVDGLSEPPCLLLGDGDRHVGSIYAARGWKVN